MKKIIFAFIISVFTACSFSIIGFAADISSQIEAMQSSRVMENLFADEYGAPSVSSDAGLETVNRETGILSYETTDVVIPGNAGLDVEITRSYNSDFTVDENGRRYTYIAGDSISVYYLQPSYKYIFKYNYQDNNYYIVFNSEEEMLRAEENGVLSVSTLSTEHLRNERTVEGTVAVISLHYVALDEEAETAGYYFYEDIAGTGINLTRDQNYEPSLFKLETIRDFGLEEVMLPYASVISQGWNIQNSTLRAPRSKERIEEDDSLYLHHGTFYDADNKNMCYFYFITDWRMVDDWPTTIRSMITAEICDDYYGSGIESSEIYTIEVNFTEVEDEVFEYDYIISRNDGVKMYFDYWGRLYKKTDKYGNSIKYEYTSKTSKKISKITDTYSREINFNYTAGTLTSITMGGEILVSYATEIVNGEYDVNNYLDADNTYLFKVSKYNDETSEIIYSSYLNQDLYKTGSHTVTIEPTTPYNTYCLKRITLPSGGQICYDWEKYDGKYSYSYVRDREINRVAKRYELENETSSEKLNEKSFEYSGDMVTAHSTVITSSDGKVETQEYVKADNTTYVSKKTFVLDNIVTETENLKTKTEYNYKYFIEGNYKPEKIVTTYYLPGESTVKLKQIQVYNYNDNQTVASEYIIETEATDDSEAVINTRTDYEYITTTDGCVLLKKKTTTRNDDKSTYIQNTWDTTKKTLTSTAVYEKDISDDTSTLKEKTEYTYDAYGRVLTEKAYYDASNYVQTNYSYTENTYTSENQTFNPWGSMQTVTSTTSGEIENIMNDNCETISSATATVSNTYDHFGNLLSSTDALGTTVTYQYDVHGRLTRQNNPDESFSLMTYDNRLNRITTDDSEGNIRRYQYDGIGRLTELYALKIDGIGTWITLGEIEYDSNNRITKKRQYKDEAKTQYIDSDYTYFNDGNIASEIVSEGGAVTNKTEYSYGLQTNYLTTTVKNYRDAENYAEFTTYTDKYGRTVKETATGKVNADEEATTYTQTYTYDYMGNLIKSRSYRSKAEGWTDYTAYGYDYAGRVVSETNAMNYSTTKTYDSLGRLTKETDINGNSTNYTYNIAGNVIKITYPTGRVEDLYYDLNGNLKSEITWGKLSSDGLAQQKITDMKYDWRNRMVQLITYDQGVSNPHITEYQYDILGNILKVTTGLTSNEDTDYAYVSYNYDYLNNLSYEIDAMHNRTNYKNDLLGRPIYKQDRNGTEFTFTYNASGDLTSKTASKDGETLQNTYTYNYFGQVLSDGDTTYTYDDFGRLTKEVSGDIIKTYTYDASGNRKSFVLNKGEEAPFSYTYVYDKTDNIESIRDVVSNSTLVSYTYNGDGTVAEKEINSLWPGYYYDKEKRITEVEVITDDTDLVLSRTRTYGGTGQILQRGDDLYSYDATGRLVGESKSTSVVPTASSYIFDDFNNVMVKKYTHSPDYEFKFTQGGTEYALSGISLHEKTYAYNKNNHLLEQREYVMGTSDNYSGEIELVTRYTYDGIGNLVKKEHLGQQDGSEEEYTYNLWGQLTGYSDDTTEATYTYDASGRRTSKTVNGETTYHIWDGDYIIADVDEDGSFIAKYHRFGSDLLELETGGKTYTYIVDGSGYGNVVSIALNENKKFDYSYDAYGNEISWDKTVYNPFKYSSEYHDEETGLVYLRNRYYDSSIGRFITEDPAEDGTNWYVYCGNNPVKYVDPSGLIPTPEEAAAMAEHIYKDIALSDPNNQEANIKARTVAGWRLIDVYSQGSLKLGVYIKDGDDWQNPSEYCIVNRGTTDADGSGFDWDDNLLQPIGASGDMKLSIKYSKWFSDTHSQEITFIGHSKGGGEAMANAVATNQNCITFNPAKANLPAYGLGDEKKTYSATMTHYVVEGEILNDKFGDPSIGTVVKLPTKVPIIAWSYDAWGQRTDNHQMWAVKASLKKGGY